jgi:hypothetical protein
MFTDKKELQEKLKTALREKQEWMEQAVESDAKATRLESQNETLDAKIEALESLNQREVKTKTKEIELDNREKVLAAQEGLESELKKKIKSLEGDVVTAKDKGYKEGYADGTADGIRKGMDLTKDDRKMMAQIAALAAASHTPEATSMIAREVANGIAKDIQGELPATAGTTNKKAK